MNISSLPSQPLALAGLIAYQEGAVVSREILKSEKTTLTVFAFAQDQGLSEHTTPFTALVQVIDGEAHITVGGQEHEVKAGEILLMPANTPHALKAIKPFKMVLTMAR